MKENNDNSKFNNREIVQLLAQIALNNPSALDRIYAIISPHLFAVVLRILTRRDWAEEVLQEVFIAIWNKADQYRPDRGSPLAWLVNLTRNKAIDWLRSNPNKIDVEAVRYEDLDIFEGNGNLRLDEDDSALLEYLRKCVAELEQSQRSAITFAYLRGFTHQEVANHTNSPLGTVKSWLRRGIDQLRRCLTV